MVGVTLLKGGDSAREWLDAFEKVSSEATGFLGNMFKGMFNSGGLQKDIDSTNGSSRLFFMIIIGILIFIGILFLLSFLGKAKDKKKDKQQAETLTKIAMGQTQQQTGPVVIKTNNGFAAPPKQPQQKTAVGFGRGDNR